MRSLVALLWCQYSRDEIRGHSGRSCPTSARSPARLPEAESAPVHSRRHHSCRAGDLGSLARQQIWPYRSRLQRPEANSFPPYPRWVLPEPLAETTVVKANDGGPHVLPDLASCTPGECYFTGIQLREHLEERAYFSA